jgi:hypothetical protein
MILKLPRKATFRIGVSTMELERHTVLPATSSARGANIIRVSARDPARRNVHEPPSAAVAIIQLQQEEVNRAFVQAARSDHRDASTTRTR